MIDGVLLMISQVENETKSETKSETKGETKSETKSIITTRAERRDLPERSLSISL